MSRHGNLQKHLNKNFIQRFLLRRFHNKVAGTIRTTGSRWLLDAGCGEGFVLDDLRSRGMSLTLAGGDRNGEALTWGKTHLKLDMPLVQMDIHALPFADNTFPLVICLEVLEHIPDSIAGLRELVRVSSKHVLVSVPHEPFFRAMNFLRGKHLAAMGNDPEHLHTYSGRAFRNMVRQAGELLWHGYAFPWQIALLLKTKTKSGQVQ